MRTTLLGAAFSLGLSQLATAAPNILFVLADDMGVDASPCHKEGAAMVRMPTLEMLCAHGMVFDNAHAAPLCSPTRAMALTGQYPSRTGVGAPGALLDTDVPTVFDRLSQSAPHYQSAVIGKWHLNGRRDLDHPDQSGVPYFFGFMGGGLRDYSQWTPVENGKLGRTTQEYSTSVFADKAIEWIDQQDDPWFLWLAFNAPHSPFHAPPSDLHSFGNLSEKTVKRGSDVRKHYYAALQALDRELGRVIQSLSEKERRETVIIFMGDNGTPGQVARRQNSVKAGKGSLFDGGTRVPLVVSGPEIRSGRSDAPVVATDIFATVLDLANVAGAPRDSHSLLPLLTGHGTSDRAVAYVEMFGHKDRRTGGTGGNGWMIRDERFALVAIDGEDPRLFDMKNDPMQTNDLLEAGQSQSAAKIARSLINARKAILR